MRLPFSTSCSFPYKLTHGPPPPRNPGKAVVKCREEMPNRSRSQPTSNKGPGMNHDSTKKDAVRPLKGEGMPDREPSPLHPGERTNSEGKAINNTVLLSIADEEFAAVRQDLLYVDLPQHLVLQEPKQKVDFLYFLNSGMASRVFQTKDGSSVEVGVVGNEGFVPISAVAGLRSSPHLVVMQISGTGFRMSTQLLESAMKE